MRKIIKEIRLKKDTPDHRAGERFVLMSNNGIYEIDAGEDDPAVFYGGDIKNFDEWFEEVSDKWPHNGAAYYQPAIDPLGRKFEPVFNQYTGTAHDEARKRIGFCYKSRKACQHFINFLEAIETISHDDGFMKPHKEGFGTPYGFGVAFDFDGHLAAENIDHRIVAGEIYFDSEENAVESLKSHPDKWRIILNYNWSKGGDDED